MPEVGKDVTVDSHFEHFKGNVETVIDNVLRIEATHILFNPAFTQLRNDGMSVRDVPMSRQPYPGHLANYIWRNREDSLHSLNETR